MLNRRAPDAIKQERSDLLAWLNIEQRKAARWSRNAGGLYEFNLTGPELMRIRLALTAISDGEWQCRFVADDKRCCQLPTDHDGDHAF